MIDKAGNLIIPKKYKSVLTIKETEAAIKYTKDYFEKELSKELNLMRVSAPLFVTPESGINDNLNGVERPVSFDVKGISGSTVEIVQSLAKWKRFALKKYGFKQGEGIYTDMNAIRRDETLDNLHSVYVDQWDWEVVIGRKQRNIEYLKDMVTKIFNIFKRTEEYICGLYPRLIRMIPEMIYFITSQELEDMYPSLMPGEREEIITRDKKAVFVMNIGGKLKSGGIHDGRAPDYDDWELNGDILFYYPVLERAFEVSSMGIRVDEKSLIKQLEVSDCIDRKYLMFHSELLAGRLPYTVGGGIGQSRICMFYLNKAHIGEVQASVWPKSMIERCKKEDIVLL
jgi:aspartate--ammonia ligase